MFCIKCGTQNLEDANFCYKCGYNLKEVSKIKAPRKKIKISIKISWKGWLLICFLIFIGFFLFVIFTSNPPLKTSKKQKNVYQPKLGELKIGDTAETRIYIVKVNRVKITKTINEQNNPFLISQAKSGETFVIVNLSIKNKTSETKVWSSLIDKPKIVSNNGSEYFEEFTLNSYLKNPIKDGSILANSTKRGDLVFRIKANLKQLKFVFSTLDKTIKWNLTQRD